MKEIQPNIRPREGFERFVAQEFAKPQEPVIPAHILNAVFQVQLKELFREIARQEFVDNMGA